MNTTYFSDLVLGNLFGTKKSPALPTTYFVGLSKTAPSISGGNVSEPSGGSYSRVQLTGNLGVPSNGVVKNSGAISFPESSASWGTVTHFVLFDAKSGGNLLMYNPLTAQRTIDTGTVLTLKTGSVSFSLNGR